jgi:hypothetical protein
MPALAAGGHGRRVRVMPPAPSSRPRHGPQEHEMATDQTTKALRIGASTIGVALAVAAPKQPHGPLARP